MQERVLGTTSSSSLEQLKRCPRSYHYRYKRGLIPTGTENAMGMGTLFHLGAAAGYRAWQLGDRDRWLRHAHHAVTMQNIVDRDGLPIQLEDENVQAVCDMLSYYWEHVGRFDQFEQIVSVEEEIYFKRNDFIVRATMDLVVIENGNLVIYDHKTSSDLSGDMAHLPLDTQLHIYYLAAREKWHRPFAFVHNYVHRFDFAGKQRMGPPTWTRDDGTQPYLLTASGKAATRSNDPNDYVRRVRTPLSDAQLNAYEKVLDSRLKLLAYHELSNNWPPFDNKLGFGCNKCPYYAICTREMDGGEVNPELIRMAFHVKEEVRTSNV